MRIKESSLLELCVNGKSDIVDGPFGSNLKSEHFILEGIPTLKIQNIKEFNVVTKNLSYVSKSKFHELSRHSFKRGDIVLTKLGNPLGAAAVVEDIEEGLIVADLVRIRINQEIIDTKYLCYLLNSVNIKTQINSQSKGATRPRIKLSVIRDLRITYPPLIEQQRIVANLDFSFAALDRLIEIAKDKEKNSIKIFDQYLSNILQVKDSTWKKDILKNITLKIGSGATPKGGQASYKKEGISLIRSKNVHDIFFKSYDLARIDNDQAAKLSNVTVNDNDVLLNITGASVARCCLVQADFLPARVNQHVSIIRLKENTVIPKLLMYALVSKPYKDELLQVGSSNGATRQAITKKQIEEFTFSYPPNLDLQAKIIDKLDKIYESSLKVADIFRNQIEQFRALKYSLLSEALQCEVE